MNSPRRGGFSILLTLAIVAIVGVLAYGAGVQAGQTATAGASSVIVYGGAGFGFFGFLLFILLIGLIFRAFARPRMPWGGPFMWGGHGRWHGGPGAWQGGPDEATKADLPPFVTEWHRRMHEAPDAPKGEPAKDAGA
jgi:hypothetical protein